MTHQKWCIVQQKYPDFKKATGYGTPGGLKGVNCTHDFYPFWEGASIIPDDLKEPAPVKINGKEYDYYQVSQQQRKIERDIRATKREIEAQNSIGGDTTALQSKLRKQTADYKQFSAAAGVKVKNNRLRVDSGSSNLTNTKIMRNHVKINESRAAIEKAKTLFDIQPILKGDTVKEISIYKDLKNTDIGRHVLEFIEKNKTSVDIFYDKDTISEYGMKDTYGICIGNHIYINARSCKTKKQIVETIIHESTHIEYNIGGDLHSECICDYYPWMHRKGKLTSNDIRSIIKSVQERYPEFRWRKK